MSCNSCAKPYSLLRKEKGCPMCGFSYCSKCLNEKMFVPKLNCEAKVCAKCKRTSKSNKLFEPPDAYLKRLADQGNENNNENNHVNIPTLPASAKAPHNKDQEILDRLKKLKEDSKSAGPSSSEEIEKRLQIIKGEVTKTTDEELHERLAKLRGVPVCETQTKPVLIAPDTRTEQEQADDLMKEYLEKVSIESKYKDEFDALVSDIETRLNKLKEPGNSKQTEKNEGTSSDSDNEEEMLKKILAKVKAEALLDEDDLPPPTNDELPFCEICNEDAKMRCLGCRYLFCKQCFVEHKDDDDGCNRYESYKPPN